MKTLILPVFWSLAWSIAAADSLQPLGDEFNDAATFSQWQDIDEVEGWVLSSDEAADIHTTTPGHFRIVPRAMVWYMNLRGVLFFKEVTGDFIATTKLRVLSRHNLANPTAVPNRLYSLTGIFIHQPRPFITRAAPDPYRTDAVWPPGAFGSDYVPGTENYIFLSYGTAGNPGTRQFEIKTTRNSQSILYFGSSGVDQAIHDAWMQIIRVGDTVVCLRKYAVAAPWIVENRYPNPDHPLPAFGPTLQVGLTAYTDWANGEPHHNGGVATSWWANYAAISPGNPDLISEVDYFRLQRPDAALTEAVLQGMNVSYNPATNQSTDPPVLLSASPVAAPFLGDNANVELGRLALDAASFSADESVGSLAVSLTRSGANIDHPLSVHYQTAPGTATEADFAATTGTLTWAASDPPQKTIMIPLVRDGLPEGAESFTLALSQLDGPATFAASSPTLSATLNIRDHPFDQWRVDRFGLAGAQSAIAAPDADADHDGLNTLLEYIFNGDPVATSDSHRQPVAAAADGLAGFSFQPADSSPGVRLSVQASDALGRWDDVAVRPAGSESWTVLRAGTQLTMDGAVWTVLVPPGDLSRQFLRLRAAVE